MPPCTYVLAYVLSSCQDAFVHTRQFSASSALLARKQKTTIRVPSKQALASKARRKAAAAAAEDAKQQKLTLQEAIAVLRSVEVASPNCAYELFIKTDFGSGTTVPKGRVALPREPKSNKTEETVLVFAEGRLADEAKKAGAHIVGGVELIDGILDRRIRATTILCTPALVRAIVPKLGRFLGPLGLMPSERRGTVTENIAEYIRRMNESNEWRADRHGYIRLPIAMMDYPVHDVVANVKEFMTSVKKATGNTREDDAARKNKVIGAKPKIPILKVMLSSRKGPGIRISDY
ncbi:ribosomal protein L1-like protein [Cyathus striatus]|nr:ribosomal protein L1-like protein [Cyathus striatus]